MACKACGAKLEVRNSNNDAVKLIRCPSCKATLQVVFRKPTPEPPASETLYVPKKPAEQRDAEDQSTVLAPKKQVAEVLPAFD